MLENVKHSSFLASSLRRELSPPHFTEAKTHRQKTRSAGLHPDYWYAVEWDHGVKPGQVIETQFLGTSIALFRGNDGKLRAIENRCAHRQVKLSLGNVDGCKLTCLYHGWSYEGDGRLAGVSHELFGKSLPSIQLRSYPVKSKYGLIWIFPGDPRLAETRTIPSIPELEGKNRWTCVPFDYTWRAHHSMVADNNNDLTHGYLHRKYRPFTDAKLVQVEEAGEKLFIRYTAKIGDVPFWSYFIKWKRAKTNKIDYTYDYPYQMANVDDQIKEWLLLLPIDECTTRGFWLFCFKKFDIPFLPFSMPRFIERAFMKIGVNFLVKPLIGQDGVAVEAEQLGYESHFDTAIAELNPAVFKFQRLTVRKWEEYLLKSPKE